MKQIVAFDFDGTITNRDTLLEFIKFAKGKTAFYLGFLLHLPWLLAMKCHLYPNWKTKQMIFSYFFKGVNIESGPQRHLPDNHITCSAGIVSLFLI